MAPAGGTVLSTACRSLSTDCRLGTGAHLRVLGKGRKERSAVLTRETVTILHCAQLQITPEFA
jgi:hypothetical protein